MLDKQKDIDKKKLYTLGRNHCDCYPEICNCQNYIVYENGRNYFSIHNKSIGEHVVEALNFFEKNKK